MYNYNLLNENWPLGYRNNMSGMNNGMNMGISNPSLTTPSVGYDRGNLFADLYDQYRDYRPDTLKARTEQERLFLDLSRNCFAAHELNLYLDLKPNDIGMLRLFNDYRQKSNELIREYESKYGPLNINSDVLEKAPFMWEKSPWPWEV
ncbi:MAG: spore coat protein CotJB [Mycoplasmatota bacterium]|nr:spore coat protein CotJB [Mycoplasmatota bacterium]